MRVFLILFCLLAISQPVMAKIPPTVEELLESDSAEACDKIAIARLAHPGDPSPDLYPDFRYQSCGEHSVIEPTCRRERLTEETVQLSCKIYITIDRGSLLLVPDQFLLWTENGIIEGDVVRHASISNEPAIVKEGEPILAEVIFRDIGELTKPFVGTYQDRTNGEFLLIVVGSIIN